MFNHFKHYKKSYIVLILIFYVVLISYNFASASTKYCKVNLLDGSIKIITHEDFPITGTIWLNDNGVLMQLPVGAKQGFPMMAGVKSFEIITWKGNK